MTLHSKRQLAEAVSKLEALQIRRLHIEETIGDLRQEIIDYFDSTNLTGYRDDRGNLWRMQQGTSEVWYDEKVKDMLKKHHLPTQTVYKEVVSENLDHAALKILLDHQVIQMEELQECYEIQYHAPYIRKFAPSKRQSEGDGADTNQDSRLPVPETRSGSRSTGKSKRKL